MTSRRPAFHYAYVVAAAAFVLLIAAAGVRSSPTMLIVPLEREFHWSAATISGAIAINLALFGLMGPFAAGIFERFGLRRTIASALALLAVAAALSARMSQVWQFFLLWGIMVGLGTGSIGLVAGATIVNRWFETNRGTVMGILTASNATGQLVFLP
ncbi:MAG: MFS transporter, partial [Candidatus Eremiobacteraeota bacterium]|nr:MFS transporter [Candidatus Eremiobacteraeota bacterium]